MQNRGGLRMDTFAQLLQGGDSGEIVTAGQGNASLLIKKLKGMNIEGDRMPAGGRPALADKDIQLIATWINEGATLGRDERDAADHRDGTTCLGSQRNAGRDERASE